MDLLLVILYSSRHWIQNISVLVLLILLYNFIPDRIFQEKGRSYALLVGLIFSLAAAMGILVPWTGIEHPAIGINGILVPLAGYVGGPVSAGIITGFLLIFGYLYGDGAGITPDIVVLLIAAGIGSAFYEYQRWRPSCSPVKVLLLLSVVFACLTVFIFSLFSRTGEFSVFWELFHVEIGFVIFFGLFLIGMVILQINRKKEGECELIRYQRDLEVLVDEKTTELAQINALQQATLESTADGIVVTDLQGKITGYNRAAGKILDIRPSAEVREDSLDLLYLLRYHVADPGTVDQTLLAVSPTDVPVLTSELLFRSGMTYEFSITPYLLTNEMLGKVLTFRDITGKKRNEEMLKSMNQKLLMLSGITRHDILNQITALNLYLYMVKNDPCDPQATEYLDGMEHTLRLMQQHTENTGKYQDVGIHEPVWLHPDTVFSQAAASFTDQGISFSIKEIAYEILADPLIERAFYNLIDNSIRHGDHVTTISFSSISEGDHLLLIYADNGSGVDPGEKEKIFEKGFGKHTGFGMFLVREILSITGITIRENGDFGSGARFEMKVPPGAFRADQPDGEEKK